MITITIAWVGVKRDDDLIKMLAFPALLVDLLICVLIAASTLPGGTP